jgi:hypothetical protein
MLGGVTKWSTTFAADTWYNFAYDINFSAGTVALWQSTGSGALTQVVAAQSKTVSTNNADWHIGVLRLPIAGPRPGNVTTTTGPTTTTTGGTTTTTTRTTTTTTTTSTSTSSGCTAPKYAQCGGQGWTGKPSTNLTHDPDAEYSRQAAQLAPLDPRAHTATHVSITIPPHRFR